MDKSVLPSCPLNYVSALNLLTVLLKDQTSCWQKGLGV